MTRLADICRGLGALTVLMFLLVGCPLFLYATGGLPIPDRLPAWEEVYAALMQPDHDYSVFIGALRLICWGAWLLFVAIVCNEIVRCIIGSADRPDLPAPVRPAQHLARSLVAMTALIFTASTALSHAAEPSSAHATIATAEQPTAPTPSLAPDAPTDSPSPSAQAPAGKAENAAPPSWRTRTIKRGDTLWDIARRHYGTGRQYPKIFDASRTLDQPDYLPSLTHPDRIHPGQIIRIPYARPHPSDQQPEPPAHAASPPGRSDAPAVGATIAPPPNVDTPRPSPNTSPARTSKASPPVTAGPEARGTATTVPPRDGPSVITLASGSRISIGLAAAVSLALALTRLHRRRRRPLNITPKQPGAPTPDPVTPAAAAQASKAHLDAYAERGEPNPTDSDLSSANVWPPAFDHVTIGTRHGKPIALPLPGLSIGFDGDGASGTVRAIATDLLANARRDRVELIICEKDARHLYPKTDIAALAADVTGLTITPTFDEALTHVEAEMMRRGRILLDTQMRDIPSLREDDPAEPLPHLIIVGTVPEELSLRLNGILVLGRQYHVGAILTSPWPHGTSAHLAGDGSVTQVHGQHSDDLTGAELFHLTADDAADMLHTLRTAIGKHTPEPTAPQRTAPSSPPPVLPQAPQARDDQHARVRLQLFGPVRLRTAEGPIQSGLRQNSIIVLAYLALHPEGATRDQVAAALWPDLAPDKIPSQFHTAVTTIRRVLREATGLHEPMFILHAAGRYRLDPQRIDVDVWRLSALHQQVRHAQNDAARIEALQGFADLYTDDFATDLTGEWAVAHREYLRRTALDALTELAQLTTADQPERALAALEQAFLHDPYSEPLCRSIMQLQDRLNRPDAARRTYELFSNRLLDLDIDPSDENNRLHTEIQRRHTARQRL